MAVLRYFRKDRSGPLALLSQTDRVLNDEERKEILEEYKNAARPNTKLLIDLLARSYTITDNRVKADKLRLVEEILTVRPVKGLIGDLAGILGSGAVGSATKATLFRLIAKLATDDDVAPLVKLLQHDSGDIRRAVLRVLAELKPSAVAPELSKALDEGKWSSKIEALDLLFRVSRVDCIRVCRALIKGGSEQEQRQAIRVLEKLRSDEAIGVLNDGIDHPSARIRLQIARALVKIGTPPTAVGLHKLLKDSKADIIVTALQGLSAPGYSKAIPDIIPLIDHSNYEVQLRAIEAIGYLGSEEEVMVLVEVLKHDDLRVRQMGTDAINRISEKEGTNISKLLLGLMSDRNVNVRRCVVEVLNRIQDDTLFEEVFKFLRDEDWWVREAVAQTLANIKDRRVVPAAIQLLDHEDEIMRRYGIEILVGIKDQRAVKPIIKLLHDPDWWVRERAVEALGYLGDTSVVPLLISMLQIKELTYTAVTALGELRDPRAIEPLTALLHTTSYENKIVILEALAKLDARSAVEEIKAMLVDVNKEVRLKAKEVLRNLQVDLGDALAASDRWWEQQNLSLLDTLLLETRACQGTDLLLVAGLPPFFRIEGELYQSKHEPISEEALLELVFAVLTEEQEQEFLKENDLDFSYEIPGEGRFRGNIFRHREGVNAVFRLIPDRPPTVEELQLPESLRELAKLKQGMVLFAGPAACGKTSTMAALVDLISRTRYDHIITIEDPIEYLYENDLSLVTQREVGHHTRSFSSAIRAALREDPDVIVVGELRDHETISMAMTAADTGHLILGTIHSISAPKTIDRIIDVFPTVQQHQIRSMLAESLRAVISQQLIPRKEGKGRVAAFEILFVNQAIANLIREDKAFQIPGIMTTSREQGMQTMDHSLLELVKRNVISAEDAVLKAMDRESFQQALELEYHGG
jgi:twitching motility protein PilT